MTSARHHDTPTMNTATVASRLGVTPARLDYFCYRGYLHPRRARAMGEGYRPNVRVWSESDARVAALLVQFSDEGYRYEAAARLARDEVEIYG